MNCFNGDKYISEAIDSVLSQTYENWELIIWDNLSTDNSKNIIYSYLDKRIKYYKKSNHDIYLYKTDGSKEKIEKKNKKNKVVYEINECLLD